MQESEQQVVLKGFEQQRHLMETEDAFQPEDSLSEERSLNKQKEGKWISTLKARVRGTTTL